MKKFALFLIFTVIYLVSVVAGDVQLDAVEGKSREYFEELFFNHTKKFNLIFENGKDYLRRLEIFIENVRYIHRHNDDIRYTYKLGLNQFSHLTFDEFLDSVHISGTRPPSFIRKFGGFLHGIPPNSSFIPSSVDHVKAGHVTNVKDQGNCGSCWAFSAVGAIESAYAIKYHKLQTFSEQEVVSCDVNGSDVGCNGGWMDDAFSFIKDNEGVTTSDAYPYTSGNGGRTGNCISPEEGKYKNIPETIPSTYTDVIPNSVEALQSAVAIQPVSIAIQANQLAFQHYSSGILSGRCGQSLDHGVLLVGYGTDSKLGKDYWKIKNSWSSTWGEDGYIRIERNDENICGVLSAPSYPNLEDKK
jgi:KDEL-tailed cysteine endopeptidase